MGILDEAIREHLELKRQHGADDSELKQLEDQAFGQAERPDPGAEAPTEFMEQPSVGEESQEQPAAEALNQEPPPMRREPAAGMADIQEPPEEPAQQEPAFAEEERGEEAVAEGLEQEPVAEEQSATEHEAIPSPAEHSTEERHAIADQPTQMYDVEEEFASTEVPAPPDEDLVAEEMTEPRLAPAEPLTPPPAPVEDDEDDDFFDEQRLSDELDQALEAPIEPESPSDEHEAVAAHTDEHELAPHTDEAEALPAEQGDSDEDVLEETPDFLEETPEDDQLWFEQKPPKDFDFDD